MATPGTSKALAKLEKSVADGNYYEALQLYKGVARRYNASKKYAATRELLLSGTKALLEKRQYNEATELATLYVDALALAEVPDTDAKALAEINSIYALYEGEAAGLQARVSFTRAVFKWSEAHRKKNELPDNTQLHLLVAQSMAAAGDYFGACQHFLLTESPREFGEFLLHWAATGFPSEHDLYFARAILLLAASGNLRDANSLQSFYANYLESNSRPTTPLLNYTRFMLLCLEREAPQPFVQLKEIYLPSLNRDPELVQLVDLIAERYYKISTRPAAGNAGMQNMLSNLMKSLFAGPEQQS